VSISFTDGAKPKAKVPKGHAKTRHAEVVDLLTSVAEKICEKLAKDHRKWRKGKKWVTRCDLFVERVENMAVNTGNQLIGALNKTMAEVVELASGFPYYGEMKKHLRVAAQATLDHKKPSEKDVDGFVMKDFNQWFLNVVTNNPGSNQMNKITPETREMMRKQGFVLPDEEDQDDDEFDEL
jgi:hypothetical protein